jgi:hypothetical protein
MIFFCIENSSPGPAKPGEKDSFAWKGKQLKRFPAHGARAVGHDE